MPVLLFPLLGYMSFFFVCRCCRTLSIGNEQHIFCCRQLYKRFLAKLVSFQYGIPVRVDPVSTIYNCDVIYINEFVVGRRVDAINGSVQAERFKNEIFC